MFFFFDNISQNSYIVCCRILVPATEVNAKLFRSDMEHMNALTSVIRDILALDVKLVNDEFYSVLWSLCGS